MTTIVPEEFSAAEIIRRMASGNYPREFMVTVARGFLPFSQEDLITILAYLGTVDDPEIASSAHTSMGEVPVRDLMAYAENEDVEASNLDLLARATDDPTLLEAIVRNRATSDDTVLELARYAEPATQEVIVINQSRILRRPEILDALLENPKLANETRRRALETREEFFEKKARVQEAAAAADAAAAQAAAEAAEEEAALADLLAKAALEAGNEQTLPELAPAETEDPEKVSLFTKILNMSVSDRVKLGFKGQKTERSILIRDRNRLVCSAVVRNPRLTEQEVETIAGMRNVDDEVLRLISTGRQWMAKYKIVLTLVRNPKAPIGVILPLLNRLNVKDLKNLMGDKNVGEVIRALARKLYQQRSLKA
jgi:hypothetical protein